MTHRIRLAALLAAVLATACSDSLGVAHLTAPDVGRVFATPAAIEQTIATGFQSCHNGVQTLSAGTIHAQLAVLALEGYGIINNLGIGPRAGIPRAAIQNYANGNFDDYRRLGLGARLAANAVTALDRLLAAGGTLGTAAQNLRARAFGMFAIGCQQGWLGLAFDSAGIVSPGMASDSIPPLRGAAEVVQSAIALFDSAVAIASDPSAAGTGGFPTPAAWAGGSALTADAFIRLVRSYRARFAAGVARTPAERNAADWPSIIADAENGVTADFMVTVSAAAGWASGSASLRWDLSPMYYGMADTSGGYDAWIAKPLAERDFFLIVTPDRRWPQGATRAAQQSASTAPTSFSARPFIVNRTGADVTGQPWGVSFYYNDRLAYIRSANFTGPYPAVTRAELDLLAAEGFLRTGDIAAAATRIDRTRVLRGQLPPLSGQVTSATQPVPGGAGCVPRVPAGPNFTSTACGTIWEAMKWEKRMELAGTGLGSWFFDSRGWGDLIKDTALEFPVPYEELAARRKPSYSLGGGFPSSAALGTYGF